MERFTGRSFSYLSQDHRTYRLKQNYNLLAAHEIQCGDIEVRGSKTCTGFSYGDHHFQCADSVPLGLETAMLIFVPSLLLFRVVPTCDYCIHVMSLISRPYASPPLPFHFGSRGSVNRRTGWKDSCDGLTMKEMAAYIHGNLGVLAGA